MTLFDAGTPPRQWFHGDHVAPVVRNDDPATSHEAAARIEPHRETKKGRVLAYLRARPGAWVDGHELTAREVGGSEGLRRLRELSAAGFDIERRPNPHGVTGWQYRVSADA